MSSTATSPTSTSSSYDEEWQRSEEPDGSRRKIQQKPEAQKHREREFAADKAREDRHVQDRNKNQRRTYHDDQQYRKPCGAYNYAGCLRPAGKCHYEHVYNPQAGVSYYQMMESGSRSQKGMKSNSYYAVELDDLRKRNPNSLSQAERERVKKLGVLNEWRDEDPTKEWTKKRKLELSEQQASVGLKAEIQETRLSQQEREELLHEEMKAAVDAGILEMVQRALKEVPGRHLLTGAEHRM